MEGIIGENVGAFYKIGDALGFETFEAYCKTKRDFSRSHAYRLMNSANVFEVVSPIGDIKPITESQARPLTRLAPDQQLIAWQKAVSDRSGNKSSRQ